MELRPQKPGVGIGIGVAIGIGIETPADCDRDCDADTDPDNRWLRMRNLLIRHCVRAAGA